MKTKSFFDRDAVAIKSEDKKRHPPTRKESENG
ncbi:Uncharacterised protein [Escherichia coli]|uniref:Uncharacterized protein n=1 Tax=Escherichia coli TaxID=562 RepID=A0A377BC92_ECOLX|nr:Uncharacterised protein [Escherichia coli]